MSPNFYQWPRIETIRGNKSLQIGDIMGEIASETNVFVQIDRVKFHAFKQIIVNRGDSAIAENFENREI